MISAVALTAGTQRGDHSLVSILHCIVDYHFDDRKNVKLALDPIIHESWKSPKLHSNDIALLKLAEDIDLTTYTPACLPTSGADYTGQNGRVYGGRSPILFLAILTLKMINCLRLSLTASPNTLLPRLGKHSILSCCKFQCPT